MSEFSFVIVFGVDGVFEGLGFSRYLSFIGSWFIFNFEEDRLFKEFFLV